MARTFFGFFSGGKSRWSGTQTDVASDTGDGTATASAGGIAFASGEDTAAEGEVLLRMVDLGPLTFILGAASFEAAAEGDATYAAAYSFAEADGCDVVLLGGGDTMTMSTDGAITGASSWSGVFAIDIAALDFADGAHVVDLAPDEPPTLVIDEPADLLDGNTAIVDVHASAEGASTAVEVGVSVFTLEQMSSIDAWAWAEIG